MPAYSIREATQQDIPEIINGLVNMVQAMEASGGHALENEETLQSYFQNRLNETFEQSHTLYLIAEADADIVAILEASHMQISGLFLHQEVLHIHGIYVDENFRRKGIAQELLEQAFVWGRKQACTIARLNVLVNNPAKHLYRQLGFTEFECEMTRSL